MRIERKRSVMKALLRGEKAFFKTRLCLKWEHAFYFIQTPETRKVLFRIGMNLSKIKNLR